MYSKVFSVPLLWMLSWPFCKSPLRSVGIPPRKTPLKEIWSEISPWEIHINQIRVNEELEW